jgi:hypothetical protein
MIDNLSHQELGLVLDFSLAVIWSTICARWSVCLSLPTLCLNRCWTKMILRSVICGEAHEPKAASLTNFNFHRAAKAWHQNGWH